MKHFRNAFHIYGSLLIGDRTSAMEKEQFVWESGGKFGWISELVIGNDNVWTC